MAPGTWGAPWEFRVFYRGLGCSIGDLGSSVGTWVSPGDLGSSMGFWGAPWGFRVFYRVLGCSLGAWGLVGWWGQFWGPSLPPVPGTPQNGTGGGGGDPKPTSWRLTRIWPLPSRSRDLKAPGGETPKSGGTPKPGVTTLQHPPTLRGHSLGTPKKLRGPQNIGGPR